MCYLVNDCTVGFYTSDKQCEKYITQTLLTSSSAYMYFNIDGCSLLILKRTCFGDTYMDLTYIGDQINRLKIKKASFTFTLPRIYSLVKMNKKLILGEMIITRRGRLGHHLENFR